MDTGNVIIHPSISFTKFSDLKSNYQPIKLPLCETMLQINEVRLMTCLNFVPSFFQIIAPPSAVVLPILPKHHRGKGGGRQWLGHSAVSEGPQHLSGDGGPVTHCWRWPACPRDDGCSQLQPWLCWITQLGKNHSSVSWREEATRQSWTLPRALHLSFLVIANRDQPLSLPDSPGSVLSPSVWTNHGSPLGAVSVHVDGVCCHSHGRSSRKSQPVHLRAYHPAHVSGAALQLHLHAKHTEPLRPADCRPGHGGTVHRHHINT